LEPAIREKLLEDVQIGLASNYVKIKEELTEQYIQDLKLVSMEILNTSGTITNNLLEELIQSIATAQHQDRQWVAAALKQTELNRIQDKSQLGNAFLNFASRTEQDLALIATCLTDKVIDNPNQNEIKNQNNLNQGENNENFIQNN
jgi:dGTP triphosphohydrolase